MAEGVVELLKAVEIEQQQRGRAAVLEGELGREIQATAVSQPGQLVGPGLDGRARELTALPAGERQPGEQREDRQGQQDMSDQRDRREGLKVIMT